MTEVEGGDAAGEHTGVSLELLDKLRPYMTESLMVLDHDWTVTANLAPPGGLIGRGLGLGLHTLEDMHPDDAVLVMDLGIQAFATSPGWQGSKLVRMRRGDGAYGRYEITAINMLDDPVVRGMVVRTREVPHDVVDDLPDLAATGSTIETLAELLPIGVLLLDRVGRVVFANDSACGMLDREPEQLKRDDFLAIFDVADRAQVGDVLRRITATPGREECTASVANARVERVECRFHSEGEDTVTAVVVTISDVTERHAHQRRLEERANHDALTGLRNRAALLESLRSRMEHGQPTTVAYVDLDGFKAVNDTWGHERGDHLLVAVARGLRSGVEHGVELGRYGGDEFLVLADEPGSLGTRLAEIVHAVALAEGLPVSASVGVATAGPGDTAATLIRRADEEMYRAKSNR